MEFLRKYATPLSLVTGLAVATTGLMLLFGIRGEMSDLHEWIGVAFVVALLMHLVRNWKGIGFLFKSAASTAVAVVGGLALTALIVLHLPMFAAGGQGGGPSGGPWMVVNRVAEAPIAVSAPALGLSSDSVIAKLKAKGIAVEGPQQSLSDVAKKQHVELPRLMFAVVQSEDHTD